MVSSVLLVLFLSHKVLMNWMHHQYKENALCLDIYMIFSSLISITRLSMMVTFLQQFLLAGPS